MREHAGFNVNKTTDIIKEGIERGGVQLVLLFMPDSSLTIFLFLRESFFWNLRAQKSVLKN